MFELESHYNQSPLGTIGTFLFPFMWFCPQNPLLEFERRMLDHRLDQLGPQSPPHLSLPKGDEVHVLVILNVNIMTFKEY